MDKVEVMELFSYNALWSEICMAVKSDVVEIKLLEQTRYVSKVNQTTQERQKYQPHYFLVLHSLRLW